MSDLKWVLLMKILKWVFLVVSVSMLAVIVWVLSGFCPYPIVLEGECITPLAGFIFYFLCLGWVVFVTVQVWKEASKQGD